MRGYLFLVTDLLKFWYYEAPKEIIAFFASLNSAFFQMFAIPLLLKTYFKPLKNEYRKGLVGFSRAMGMAVKSFFIIGDLIILIPLLAFEILVVVLFLVFPILNILLLFT